MDPHECIWSNGGAGLAGTTTWRRTWSHWQKPVAFVMCCAGCVVYMLASPNRPPAGRTGTARAVDATDGGGKAEEVRWGVGVARQSKVALL